MHSAMASYPTRLALPMAMAVVALTLNCGGCAPRQPATGGADAEHIRQYDRLIDAVASRNKEPKIIETGGSPIALFDDKFDWADQERVQRAVAALSQDESNDLWPRLVEHIDDERYSVTGGDDLAAPQNFSVGWACRVLAFNHLLYAYLQYLEPGGSAPMGGDSMNWVADDSTEYVPGKLQMELHEPPQLGRLWGELPGEKRLWKWYQARKGKPLYELQIEMCEWAIKRVEGDSRVAEKPKREFVNRVKRQIQLLRETKKPVVDHSSCASPLDADFWEFYTPRKAKESLEWWLREKEENKRGDKGADSGRIRGTRTDSDMLGKI
jgi:hypothetical protein